MLRTRFAATAAVLGTTAALAAPGAGAATSGQQAMVRVAHFSPDAPAVDVYANGERALSGVTFKQVSQYLSLPTGTQRLEVRPAGAAPTSQAVISASPSLEGGKAYTVAAVGPLSQIRGQVAEDDLSSPASGKAKVRVWHAAPEVPAVDVAVRGGPTLFSGATFPNATNYAEVDPATYAIEVRAAGQTTALLSASLPVTSGTISTVAAVGGAGKPVELLPISDASGMAATPSGGVETGAGGTADGSTAGGRVLPLAAAGAAFAGAAAFVTIRRRYATADVRNTH